MTRKRMRSGLHRSSKPRPMPIHGRADSNDNDQLVVQLHSPTSATCDIRGIQRSVDRARERYRRPQGKGLPEPGRL